MLQVLKEQLEEKLAERIGTARDLPGTKVMRGHQPQGNCVSDTI